MTCKDPSITYLKDVGYNVVRIPKADVQPLQILIKDKRIMKNLGDLSSLLVQGENVALPPIKRDVPMANISGKRTSDLSFGIGISILGTIIGAMGGSKLGLDVKYANARSIAFEFTDVLEDAVEIVKLDQYLGDADVNPGSRYVAELLEADEIYVITAVIKSASVTVEGKKKNDTTVGVSVPEIQEIVGGNIDVKAKGDSEGKITFKGRIPLAFGFQAVQLVYENGRYSTFQPLKAGQGAVAIDGDTTPALIEKESTFINF
jgi:hypothetical protein